MQNDLIDEPTAEEFYQKRRADIYGALRTNGLTVEVASFLAELAVRVEKLERYDL